MSEHEEGKPQDAAIRRFLPERAWEGVQRLSYKPSGTAPFRDISRQVLFDDESLACELRYFEIAPGGYSTLERHGHAHGVLILLGSGACLVGSDVRSVRAHDLVRIPPWAWHQLRADAEQPLGFLCMVNRERDRPVLPSEDDLAALRSNPDVAAFIRI